MGKKRNPIYDKAYEIYLSGLSLKQVADQIKVTRQCVFKAFKKRGFALRDRLNITPSGYEAISKHGLSRGVIGFKAERTFRHFQLYDGLKFTLRNNGYYACTTGDRTQMHRYVWTKEKGTIPNGWDIHHIDEVKSNNNINNLECLPKSEHTKKYSTHNKGGKRASN